MTNDNCFNQVARSSKEGLYLPHKSEYITFVGHPSQQLQHPYWHHINTQSEGSLSYLWEIPLLTALRHPHWHQYLLVWGYLYPNCIHTGNTSILKMHPYGNTSLSKMYLYWQHINTLTASILASIPKLHSYWQHINTQNSSMLAAQTSTLDKPSIKTICHFSILMTIVLTIIFAFSLVQRSEIGSHHI